MPLPAGTRLGRYEVRSALGAGGMGEVYLAWDSGLERQVALKVLPADVASDPQRMGRFLLEARATSALNHPNILSIHDAGETDSARFIVMEYVEGATLRQRMAGGRLDLREALDVAAQVASALSEAHAAGIVHRDIKPENVMLRRGGIAKVLDFGIAKLTERRAPAADTEAPTRALVNTGPGTVIGTVSYMSPEQARGLEVDARTDIWSLGVVLYETVAGQLPFEGQTATDVLATILHREPQSLRLRRHDAPAELERIVEKALAKDREERYQTAKDLAADLRRLRQRLEVEAEIERMHLPEESQARLKREREDTRPLAPSKPDSQASPSTSITSSSEKLPPHNLSAELSPLIGREAELAEIAEMLRQAEIRLLTITGVGGTGKTRLTQAVAHHALAEFADGVYFINLSAIESAELVVPIIAQTLGVHEEGGKPLRERLREHLRERKVLIVLDNFEQITRAAPQVGELLSGSANLKILVTSRVRLYLRFEHEFPLQPLTIPAQGRLRLSELRENPAIALFVERAQAVKPAFALTEENAQAVAEICRRLDGLPLAIELAAVRVKLLAPQAILTRLSNSLKLLTGGARDVPERQQTMRAAIKWSYDLLDAEEQNLLNRLAVFGGGFTLDAAEKVANSEADWEIDSFDGIASLVDKSLLLQSEQADGEPRFRMLVVVREFALEELEAGGEAEEVKKRHAEFYAQMAESAEPELLGGKAGEWLETLEQEHDNLRFALEWSLGREPVTALRIVGAIMRFWYKRGYFSEGSKWTRAALERNGEEADTILQAKAYSGLSQLIWSQGDLESAERFAQEGLRLAREISDRSLICISLGYLGVVKRQKGGEMAQAKTLSEEALALAREMDDKVLISTTLNSLGEIARHQEDYETAREFYVEALALARQESANHFISITTQNLAMVSCFLEDYNAALSYTRESLKISEELGGKINIGITLQIFASLAVVAGETEKAARLFGTAQAIHNAAGYKLEEVDQKFVDRYVGVARARMGDEAFEAGFQEGKQMRMKKAIALARETG